MKFKFPKWLGRLPVKKARGASKHERGRRKPQGLRNGRRKARKRQKLARRAQRGRR